MRNGEPESGLAETSLIAFLATADPPRSIDFFQRVLGLTLRGDDEFALVFESNGTMIRIQKVERVQPPPYTALGWQTKSLERTVGQLVERGVRFEHYPGLEQDKLGIWSSPGGAKVAWFKDPDGNLLSLTQMPISLTTQTV